MNQGSGEQASVEPWHLPKYMVTYCYSFGHLLVISTYNPIYRMYNPIEITSYNW